MAMIETRDGAWLYVKDWGKGDPVVLIHGWPLSSDSWDPVADALANAGHRVISYDRRGFWRSEQTWDGYDYDSLSDDLADVLQATGATDNVTLVGFSMGGGEVARYMSRHSGAGVVRAALIASVVPYMLQTDDNPDGVPQETFDQMTQQMLDDRPAFMKFISERFFSVLVGLASLLARPFWDWAWRLTMQAGLRPTLKCAEAFSSTDFRPDLPSFQVPTLIIHGTADKTVSIEATGRMAASMIDDVQLVEYSGSPHGLFETDRDRLIGDLMAFLNGEEVRVHILEEQMVDPVLPMGSY